MAKVSTKAFINLRNLVRDIPKNVGDRETQAIADATKDKMLDLISKGISPIKGMGRFPAYLASSRGGKKKTGYPYNTEEYASGAKRARPVNLKLTGKFLESIKPLGRNLLVTISLSTELSKIKEEGHRLGAGGQPSRPIIPGPTENFSDTITNMILKMLKQAVRKAIKARV